MLINSKGSFIFERKRKLSSSSVVILISTLRSRFLKTSSTFVPISTIYPAREVFFSLLWKTPQFPTNWLLVLGSSKFHFQTTSRAAEISVTNLFLSLMQTLKNTLCETIWSDVLSLSLQYKLTLRAHLHQASASMLRHLCDDAPE